MSWLRKRRDTTEHRYTEDRLSAYLDGDLSPKEQQAVGQHLASCPACQWELDTLEQTVQWTQELPTIPVPRVFTIQAPAQPVPVRRQRRGWLPLLQGATALIALLLVVIVAGDVMLMGVRPGMPAASTPALAPQPQMMEPAVADVVPTQEVAQAEVEITTESEAAVIEGGAGLDEEPAPEAPVESPAEGAEAPLVLEAEVASSEAAGTTAMGAGSPDVQEKAADEAEAPLAAMVEEAVEEAEPTVAAAKASPTLAPTAPPPARQPQTPAPPTSVPTIVAQALERGIVTGQPSAIQTLGLMRQRYVNWLRLVECSLGALLLVLGAVTVVAIVRRR